MKKIIAIIVILLIAAIIVLRLSSTKKQLDEKAKVKIEVKNVAVTTKDVAMGDIDDELNFTGTFEPNKEVNVISETNGKVIKSGAEEGDNVAAGKMIAQTDLTILHANKDAAEALVNKLDKDVQRTDNLFKGKAATEVQLQDVKYSYQNAVSNLAVIKKQIENATILAPISGTISKRNFENGSVLMPGTLVCTITDVSKLKLKINVPEQDIVKYKVGEKVQIATDVYSGKVFTGSVSVVGVKSLNSKMFPVEILVQNDPKTPLKAGMYGKTNLAKEKIKNVMIIDRQSIVGSIQDPAVFVIDNNKAYIKKIKIGEIEGNKVRVISGLNQGEKVVTTGQINLENGYDVTVTNNSNQ